ncbi:MAG: hypothetical protein RL338_127 [Chloroflexota bacterium]
MRIDARTIGTGVGVLLAGAIPFAVMQGALELADVSWATRLWPLILVGAGLALVLDRTPLGFVGSWVASISIGLIAGSILAAVATGGSVGSLGCDAAAARTPFSASSGTLAPGGRVEVTLDCGSLDLATGTGDAWRVEGRSATGEAPAIEATGSRLAVRSADRGGPVLGLAADRSVAWRVTAPASATRHSVTVNAGAATLALGGAAADLSATVNAGSLVAALERSALRSVGVTVNAGSASLTFPDADVTGSVTVNAGSIELCVPSTTGLRIETKDGALGSNDFGERGLVRSGDAWISTNWEAATHRIALEATANAGSLSLNPEGGCR